MDAQRKNPDMQYQLLQQDSRFLEERARLPVMEVEELPPPVQPPVMAHQIPAFLRLQAE
jgi:hypothetical protein